MFGSALETERALGLDRWATECPPVAGIFVAVPAPDGGKQIEWAARLDWPAPSLDQRLKVPAWLGDLVRYDGELVIREADVEQLERYAGSHDPVVVATGKGALANLFPRDTEKSPYDAPQRALTLTYVTGMAPRPEHSAVCFTLAPRNRRVLRRPGADDERLVRNHGLRGSAGRTNGLLGRCPVAGGAPGTFA